MTHDDDMLLRGTLQRRTGFFHSWKPFSFELKRNLLVEYKAGSNPVGAQPLSIYDLKDSLVEDASGLTGRSESFIVHLKSGRSVFLLAATMAEKTTWETALKDVHKLQKFRSNGSDVNMNGGGGSSRMLSNSFIQFMNHS